MPVAHGGALMLLPPLSAAWPQRPCAAHLGAAGCALFAPGSAAVPAPETSHAHQSSAAYKHVFHLLRRPHLCVGDTRPLRQEDAAAGPKTHSAEE